MKTWLVAAVAALLLGTPAHAQDETAEIDTIFAWVTPGKGALTSHLNDSPTQVLDLSPVDPDTFQRGLQTVRFLRDAAGKVVALELTNPALRRIRFTTRRP